LFSGSYDTELELLLKKYEATETLEERDKRKEDYTYLKQTKAELYVGVYDLLYLLSKEYTLTINTSASYVNCIPILERLDIINYFDLILTRDDDMGKVKKFEIIANRYQIKTSELLFVTDSLSDVIQAQEANVPTIAVSYGIHGKEYFNLSQYSCILDVADSVDEMLMVIKNKH